jgi:hypothetical protein
MNMKHGLSLPSDPWPDGYLSFGVSLVDSRRCGIGMGDDVLSKCGDCICLRTSDPPQKEHEPDSVLGSSMEKRLHPLQKPMLVRLSMLDAKEN